MRKTFTLLLLFVGLGATFAQNAPTPAIVEGYILDNIVSLHDKETKMDYVNHELIVKHIGKQLNNFDSFNREFASNLILNVYDLDTLEQDYLGYVITTEDLFNTIQGCTLTLVDKKAKKEKSFHFTQEELKTLVEEHKRDTTDHIAKDANHQKLDKESVIEEINEYSRENCPTEIDRLQLKEVFVEQDMVTYRFEVSQDLWLYKDTVTMMQEIESKIKYDNSFFYRIQHVGLGLQYIYHVEGIKDPIVIAISPTKLRNIIKSRHFETTEEAEIALQEMVEEINANTSLQITQYTIFDTVVVEKEQVVIYHTIVNMSKKQFKKSISTLKRSIESKLDQNHGSFLALVCYHTNRDLIYYYTLENANYILTFKFNNSQLEGIGKPYVE